jgi:hypothetical protein
MAVTKATPVQATQVAETQPAGAGRNTLLQGAVLALLVIALLSGPLWVTLGVFTGRLVFYYDKDDVALSVVALAVPTIGLLAGGSAMTVDNTATTNLPVTIFVSGIGLLGGLYCIFRSIAYSVIDNNGVVQGVVIGLTKISMAWLMILMMINAGVMILGGRGRRGQIARGVIVGGLTAWLYKHLVNGKAVYLAMGRSPR